MQLRHQLDPARCRTYDGPVSTTQTVTTRPSPTRPYCLYQTCTHTYTLAAHATTNAREGGEGEGRERRETGRGMRVQGGGEGALEGEEGAGGVANV